MNRVTLTEDLKTLAAQHPGLMPLVQRVQAAAPDFATRAPLLGELGAQAQLGTYGTLALLLKANWTPDASRWCPWLGAERLREPLGEDATRGMPAADFELLVLEQCALSCHLVGRVEVAGLARRHDAEQELLAVASEDDREVFLTDKRAWLLDEHQYDWLLDLSQQLVAELASTRIGYLGAIGKWLFDYVEAAHRLALMRYRTALDDPKLTTVQLALLLQRDLTPTDAEPALVPLEPELRQALFDTAREVQDDNEALQYLARICSQGDVRPASDEDRRLAALLLHRLRQLIHPDHLERHKDYAEITPENKERLRTILDEATGMHRSRVFLSRDRLINYVENLQRWIAEVERILRGVAFHGSSRLLIGDALDERHADLRRAMVDVQCRLHAVRDEIAQLEFDPRHAEYRRVIAMGDAQLKAERERMTAQTDRWNAEARGLSAALAERHPDARHSDDPAGLERGA